MYKSIIRPLLFRFEAETAHHIAIRFIQLGFKIPGLKWLTGCFFGPLPNQQKTVMGLTFKNPVGLAAGFDKDAKIFNELEAFGFGFIEIGTLTPLAQPGNPKPRVFRLVEDESLINRMGFNNGGLDEAVERLKKRKPGTIIGGNIGKNKVTPNDQAISDYLKGVEALHEHVDYFVVNVSSPNTPNLRELQEKGPLMELLQAVQKRNDELSKRPLLLKIAPDLTDGQLDDIIEIVNTLKLDGIIATNTTIDRGGLKTDASKIEAIGAGGLSGKVLRKRSTEIIHYLKSKLDNNVAIIAVGGVFTAQDAKEKLEAGADLVQVWTGFLYEGPGMVRRILKGL
jgi:dihydroorotate dehydrogenase